MKPAALAVVLLVSLAPALVAPMFELAFVNGVGRRVDESGLGLMPATRFPRPTRI